LLAAVRITVVLGLCGLLSGCFTMMMWQEALRKEGAFIYSESLKLVSLTPGKPGVMTVETSEGQWPSGRFRLEFQGGAPHWEEVLRTWGLRACRLKLEMLYRKGSVPNGEGTLTLGGELRNSVRPMKELPMKGLPPLEPAIPLEARSGIVLDGPTWWQRAHGSGKGAPFHYQALAWLRNGRPLVDDAEVWQALGSRDRVPDLSALAGYELCVEAREVYGWGPTWFAVRADALWLGQWGAVEPAEDKGSLAWSHRTTWDVVAVTAGGTTAVNQPVTDQSTPPDKGQSNVSITWHEGRSRTLPVIGAVIATPIMAGLDVATYTVFMVYVFISGPFTHWEGPF